MSDFKHLSYDPSVHTESWFLQKTPSSLTECVRLNSQLYDNFSESPLLQERRILEIDDGANYRVLNALMTFSNSWFKTDFPWKRENIINADGSPSLVLELFDVTRPINDSKDDAYSQWILSDFIIQDAEILLTSKLKWGAQFATNLLNSKYFIENSKCLHSTAFLEAQGAFGKVAHGLNKYAGLPLLCYELIKQHQSLRDFFPSKLVTIPNNKPFYDSVIEEYELLEHLLNTDKTANEALILRTKLNMRSNLIMLNSSDTKAYITQKIGSLERKIHKSIMSKPDLLNQIWSGEQAPTPADPFTVEYLTLLTNELNFKNASVSENELASENVASTPLTY